MDAVPDGRPAGAKRTRSGWNGAQPEALPPLTAGERVRLWLRGIWSVLALGVLFSLILVLRIGEVAIMRVAGRRVTAASNAVVRLWAALALPVLGLRYVQHGRPMAMGGAFVANHSSWLDIVVLQRAAAPFLVSKAEVRQWPVIGFIGRAIGTMFIDRRPAEAKRQEQALLWRLKVGDRMALFPEGTSSDGRRVLPFKSTLFGVFLLPEVAGAVAVQPVTIVYRARPGLPAAFYGWWGEMDFASHFTAVLARSTGGVVEVTFHPPLAAAGDRKALAAAAEAAVRAGFPAG